MSATANRVYDAPIEKKEEVPAFKIVRIEADLQREVYSFDEKSRKLVKGFEQIEGGYMVLFPRGHSLFYHSLEALEANGYGDLVPIIRMDQDGEMSKNHQPPAAKSKIHSATED